MSVTISDDIISLEKFSKLYDVIAHLYGPNSNHVIIHNKTVFSSCDLFTFLLPKCDVIKMMLSYLKNQLLLYKDGGLFVAMVTINLIRRYTVMEVPLPDMIYTNRSGVAEIEQLCKELALKSNIGKLKDVSKVIKTIISSKLTLLKATEMEHLCLLLARTFTIHNPLENCHVVLKENSHIEESQLHDGLLLQLDKYFDPNFASIKKIHEQLSVILFSVSLAVDSEELLSEGDKSVVNVESVDEFKGVVLKTLLDIGRELTPLVDVVISQKVIHPHLKRLFKNSGVVCVDRVGGNIMPLLQTTCGCQAVSSLVCRKMNSFIGHVPGADIVQISGKFYYKLYSQATSNLKTLVLCSKNEHGVNALQHCYETSMLALKALSNDGFVVCGGGCMETQISMRLQRLRQSDVLCEKFKHLDVIIFSLLSASMGVTEESSALNHSVDNMYHHHWVNIDSSSRCCCGALLKHPEFRFISFLELFHSSPENFHFSVDSSELSNFEIGQPAIVHVRDIYICNLRSVFELAGLVLRIGIKIIPN